MKARFRAMEVQESMKAMCVQTVCKGDLHTCMDPESFVRGGPTLKRFFFFN